MICPRTFGKAAAPPPQGKAATKCTDGEYRALLDQHQRVLSFTMVEGTIAACAAANEGLVRRLHGDVEAANQQAMRQIAHLQRKDETRDNQFAQFRREYNALAQKLARVENKLARVENELARVENELARVENELAHVKQHGDAPQQENKHLQRQVDQPLRRRLWGLKPSTNNHDENRAPALETDGSLKL